MIDYKKLPPPHVRRQLCGQSLIAEATLIRYFTGAPIQPVSRARIEKAARELGLDAFIVPAAAEEG